MSQKKRSGKASAAQDAPWSVWQEVLNAVAEFDRGHEKRPVAAPRSPVARARQATGLSQSKFAALLGVSKRTLEQWEQGRREPSGAAKTLLKVAERHPEVLRELIL